MENNYIIEDFRINTETEFFTDGEIRTYPAQCEGSLQILCGIAQSVTVRGKMQIFDSGDFRFSPSVSTSTPRFETIYASKHAELRETKKSLVCVIRIPKHWDLKRILAVHYETFLSVHSFIKNIKKRRL